ncbi:MAG: hypothetical protein IPG21_16390 [Saprospiraceae bacterium]|nr:hypothetical protein [Candidatus Vicinibacter affinis]MBK7798225.1 hypothetical protein [Candidatus Vicinibacter affinis]
MSDLVQGERIFSSVLYNSKEEVVGYVYVYSHENPDPITRELEYVMLDQNLNLAFRKVINYPKLKYYTPSIRRIFLVGDSLFVQQEYCTQFCFTSIQYLALKGSAENPEYVQTKNGLEVLKYNKKYSNDYFNSYKNFNYTFFTNENANYLVDGFIRNKFNTSYEPLRIHKTDNSLLWKHDFNKSDIKGTIVGCEVQLATSRFIYVLTLTRKVSNSRPRKLLNRNILCFDALTGDIRYNYPLVDIESQYLRTMKLFEKDGKLLILGNYSEEPLASSESEIKDLGYYSIAVDESGKELRKTFNNWASLCQNQHFNKFGVDKAKYQIGEQDIFLLKDGSTLIFTKKVKPERSGLMLPIPFLSEVLEASTNRTARSKDYILFHLDSQFTLIKEFTINKEVTKGESIDLMYTQYLHDKDGIVLFYKRQDDNKVKDEVNISNWKLCIGKFINGSFEEEKVPLSSKESHRLFAIPAKFGYMLLTEVDINDNLLEVRLEKLN